jgi:tetratricopeptide (TPR) repeat protein
MIAAGEQDLQAARAYFEESLALFRAIGDQRQVARVLTSLSVQLLREGGAAEQIRTMLEESISIARAVGDKRQVAVCLGPMGILAAREGEDRQARRLLDESLAYFREIGDVFSTAMALEVRGWFAWGRADLDLARRDLEEALAITRRLGDNESSGMALSVLGCLAHDDGDLPLARTLLEESAQHHQQTHTAWMFYQALAYLGHRAIDRRRDAIGVRILAAVDARFPHYVVLASLQPLASPAERAAVLIKARFALSEEAFAAAWAEGQAMTLEQALAYALEEDDG